MDGVDKGDERIRNGVGKESYTRKQFRKEGRCLVERWNKERHG